VNISAPVPYQSQNLLRPGPVARAEYTGRAREEAPGRSAPRERVVEGEVLYGPRAGRRAAGSRKEFPKLDDFPFVFYRAGDSGALHSNETDPIASYQAVGRAETYLYPRLGTQVNVYV